MWACPRPAPDVVRRVKELTGRMIGINLEPVDPAVCAQNEETIWAMSRGRYATAENAQRAMEMGVDLIVLTGNPGNGVSNEAIVHSLESIRAHVGEGIVLAAGKMHASGVVRAARTSSPKRMWPPLPLQVRTSSCCLPPAPCPALPLNMCAGWSAMPTVWAA